MEVTVAPARLTTADLASPKLHHFNQNKPFHYRMQYFSQNTHHMTVAIHLLAAEMLLVLSLQDPSAVPAHGLATTGGRSPAEACTSPGPNPTTHLLGLLCSVLLTILYFVTICAYTEEAAALSCLENKLFSY